MKNKIELLGIVIGIAALIGWVLNIITLITKSPALSEWGGMEVLRAIGVFCAPLGGVLGYI